MSDTLLAIIATLVKGVIIIVALLTVFAYMTLIERRVIARFQSRLGPNRAGPLGLLQPLADAIKMAFKEQIIPTRAKVFVYMMAPCLSIFVALVAFAVVPLGDNLGGLPSIWNPSAMPPGSAFSVRSPVPLPSRPSALRVQVSSCCTRRDA